jgi:hypothetical protein
VRSESRYAGTTTQEIIISLALNNTQRALAYACSDMGEVMTLSTDGTTVSTK